MIILLSKFCGNFSDIIVSQVDVDNNADYCESEKRIISTNIAFIIACLPRFLHQKLSLAVIDSRKRSHVLARFRRYIGLISRINDTYLE